MSEIENTKLTKGRVSVSQPQSAATDLRIALEADKSLKFDRPHTRGSGEFGFWLPDSYPIWDGTWEMFSTSPLFLKQTHDTVDLDARLEEFTEQRSASPILVIEFKNQCYVRLVGGKGSFGDDTNSLSLQLSVKRRSDSEIACECYASVAEVWKATEVMEYETGDSPNIRFPKKHPGLPLGDFSSGRHREGMAHPPRITLASRLENMPSLLDCARDTIAVLIAQLGEPLMARFVLQAMGDENRKKMVEHSLTISDRWDMDFYGQYAKGFSPYEPIADLTHPRIFPNTVAEFTDQEDGRFDQVLDMQISVRHQPDQPIDLLLHSSHDFEFMRRIASSAGLEVEQLPDRFPDGPTR